MIYTQAATGGAQALNTDLRTVSSAPALHKDLGTVSSAQALNKVL